MLEIFNSYWLAIIVGAVLAYGLGGIWYSPKLFCKQWMAAQPHRKESDYKSQGTALVIKAIATVLMAVLVASLVVNFGVVVAFALVTLPIAFGMWSGGLFMGHSKTLMLVNIGHEVLAIAIMAGAHLVL